MRDWFVIFPAKYLLGHACSPELLSLCALLYTSIAMNATSPPCSVRAGNSGGVWEVDQNWNKRHFSRAQLFLPGYLSTSRKCERCHWEHFTCSTSLRETGELQHGYRCSSFEMYALA